MQLVLLSDTDFSWKEERASLSQFFEMTFEGKGRLNESEASTFYTIYLADRKLGSIWQSDEDQTWTALPNKANLAPGEVRPDVCGFATEMYAAEYLKEIAARAGLLDGTEYVYSFNLNEGRSTPLLGVGEEIWGYTAPPVTVNNTEFQEYGEVRRLGVDCYRARTGGRADGTGFEATFRTIQKALKAAKLPVKCVEFLEDRGNGVYKIKTQFDQG